VTDGMLRDGLREQPALADAEGRRGHPTKVRDYLLDPEILEGAILDAIRELRPTGDTLDATRIRVPTRERVSGRTADAPPRRG
jgi:hypothetical protein